MINSDFRLNQSCHLTFRENLQFRTKQLFEVIEKIIRFVFSGVVSFFQFGLNQISNIPISAFGIHGPEAAFSFGFCNGVLKAAIGPDDSVGSQNELESAK